MIIHSAFGGKFSPRRAISATEFLTSDCRMIRSPTTAAILSATTFLGCAHRAPASRMNEERKKVLITLYIVTKSKRPLQHSEKAA